MRSAFTHWSARRVADFPTLVSLTPRASVYRSVVTVDSRERKRKRGGKREREKEGEKERGKNKKRVRCFSRKLL